MRNLSQKQVLGARLLSGGLVIAGLLASAEPRTEACPRHYPPRDPRPTLSRVDGRFEVRVNMQGRYYRFAGSNLQLQAIYVFTRDKALARFLESPAGPQASWTALSQTASRYSCADLMEGRDLLRVEQAVARALVAEYRKVSKQSAVVPDLMLGLWTPYQAICQPPVRPARP